jgi:hypothetical protein
MSRRQCSYFVLKESSGESSLEVPARLTPDDGRDLASRPAPPHCGDTKAAARSEVLGDNIRRYLIFDEGDAIAQLQLALFQPLQPQQIRRGRLMQGIDRRVEISVFLLQPCELDFEFALIFVGHGVR